MLRRIFCSRILWIVCAVAVLVFIMLVTGIGCPIRYLTGVSCAGCGMTRALFSALLLDFESAFSYHPLWVALIPICVMLAVLVKKKRIKAFYCLLLTFAAAMLAVYLYRLVLTDSDTVTCDISSGAIYKLLSEILS